MLPDFSEAQKNLQSQGNPKQDRRKGNIFSTRVVQHWNKHSERLCSIHSNFSTSGQDPELWNWLCYEQGWKQILQKSVPTTVFCDPMGSSVYMRCHWVGPDPFQLRTVYDSLHESCLIFPECCMARLWYQGNEGIYIRSTSDQASILSPQTIFFMKKKLLVTGTGLISSFTVRAMQLSLLNNILCRK